MSKPHFSLAIGVGSKNRNDQWLEVFYPKPILNPAPELLESIAKLVGYQGGNTFIELDSKTLHALEDLFVDIEQTELAAITRSLEESVQPRVITMLATDEAPTSTPEAYLKLHLLSHRLVKPHGTDLQGIFPLLPNVAWTSEGAIDLEELPARQLAARAEGRVLSVNSVDKFPKMTDYVVPAGVRIAHTARVRLGAYVGEGTTVMHEGFINFNAGTEGKSMIEGRVSAGVMVGEGSDLGGGCSTMGTLSGGNNIVISVGENCLIGANAGLGIPLGDRCIIEAGLYLTAASKVQVLDDQKKVVEVVKAGDLSGKSDLLFRRNSLTGALECLTNKSAIELNDELHSHN
ncbi:2,3,4,5-tetrahydropyridine-2,6-dicarboxylate N-succinyltransferase [Endozoicomonas sp. GU-1]|uniref:2,3,4,5-tetrahydropyridine-2,6-dicarboxylate N-succinyltransferase n=1 Tax=Endozoicomonas sp. GU-1 TaxID=3009078 RepID=UPI0022B2FB0E|nr:2,3,4,5-tetrahydropyridine-2,6-dicarboxylate N-succinyltransferase [Endozoicomonas sp. GU-1]WBA83155.1 2,3,4,5-tetrahydropyridine-2,6-dicarboxylate N-succinyltransferase [Endozoicomonas sp. GU-1]WBA86080.1 2,3,4,5-tetrahydropyridine-2,6-dicarboxylate N-succinyltransferase [Endozoicomonas sp. GU-1]